MKYFNKPPLGTPLNPMHPLNRGLVGYWGFGEGAGSKTQDLSGQGNHGTLTNIVQGATSGFTGGKFGGAMMFDGTDDFTAHGNTLNMGLNNWTISAWIKTTSSAVSNYVSKTKAAAQNFRYNIRMASGKASAFMQGDGGSDVIPIGTKTINDNTWHHTVAVFDRKNLLSVYTDGSLDASASIAHWVNANMISDNPFRNGSGTAADNIGVAAPLNGQTSEVRIYNRALSVQEVQQLYADPFCMFEQKSIFRQFLGSLINKGSFFFSK